MSGRLYMIGTPIGNLGDLSARALETLRGLDMLYCEDTRVTGKLLSHFSIAMPLSSLSDDAPESSYAEPAARLQRGESIGFTADAGMPGVSDPGRKLVRLAWQLGIVPTVIPGPSSVGTLLAACPFMETSFSFRGYPPRKPSERAALIAQLAVTTEPVFLFESPHRAHELLGEICAAVEPTRQLLVGREMTKLFEQFALFAAADWPERSSTIPALGEFTIAVGPTTVAAEPKPVEELRQALARLLAVGFSKRDATKALAAIWQVHPNEIKAVAYHDRDDAEVPPV